MIMQSELSIKRILLLIWALAGWLKTTTACGGVTNYNLATINCMYAAHTGHEAESHQYASDTCAGKNSLLAPVFKDPANFLSFLDHFQTCENGHFHTAYTYDSTSDDLILGEKVIDLDIYNIAWNDSSRPTPEQACIKATISSSSRKNVTVSPVDCNEKLMFLCVDDPCYNNGCEPHQTCVRADETCHHTCQESTTTEETLATTTNRPVETSAISQDESSPVPEEQRSTTGPPGENHTLVVVLVVILVTFIIVVILLCIVCRNTDACRQIPVRFRGLCNGNRRAKPSSPYQVQA